MARLADGEIDRVANPDRHARRRLARTAPAEVPRVRGLAPGGGMAVHVESETVTFGDVVPGSPTELPTPLAIRVVSDRNWMLLLEPARPLHATEPGADVSTSRLLWRAASRADFAALDSGTPAVLARGAPTSTAGTLVLVDLRLLLEPSDPLGPYIGDLRLSLEPR